MALHHSSQLQVYRALLGVDESATPEQIRDAFRRRAKIAHPDKFNKDTQTAQWAEANEMLTQLNEAYKALSESHHSSWSADGTAKTNPSGTRKQTAPTPKAPVDPAEELLRSKPDHLDTFGGISNRDIDMVSLRTLRKWAKSKKECVVFVRVGIEDSHAIRLFLSSLAGSLIYVTGLVSLGWPKDVGIEKVGYALGVSALGSWFLSDLSLALSNRINGFPAIGLYIVPNYLISVSTRGVAFLALWSVVDIQIVEHRSADGQYQKSVVKVSSASTTMSFPVPPKRDALKLVEAIRIGRESALRTIMQNGWGELSMPQFLKAKHRNNNEAGKSGGVMSGLFPYFVAFSVLSVAAVLPTLILSDPVHAAKTDRTVSDSNTLKESGAAQPEKQTPGGDVIGFPSTLQKSLPLPPNGLFRVNTDKPLVAPLTIQAAKGSNYFFKLVEEESGSEVISGFVSSGSAVSLDAPLGEMRLRYATGRDWYGEKHLFGITTQFSEADRTLDFTQDGDQVSGYTVILELVQKGNLRVKRLSSRDF